MSNHDHCLDAVLVDETPEINGRFVIIGALSGDVAALSLVARHVVGVDVGAATGRVGQQLHTRVIIGKDVRETVTVWVLLRFPGCGLFKLVGQGLELFLEQYFGHPGLSDLRADGHQLRLWQTLPAHHDVATLTQ